MLVGLTSIGSDAQSVASRPVGRLELPGRFLGADLGAGEGGEQKHGHDHACDSKPSRRLFHMRSDVGLGIIRRLRARVGAGFGRGLRLIEIVSRSSASIQGRRFP